MIVALLLSALASGCDESDARPSEPITKTYALTATDWCAGLALEDVVIPEGLGTLKTFKNDHAEDDDGTVDQCEVHASPEATELPPSSPPVLPNIEGITIQVYAEVRSTGPAPDLKVAKEFYRDEPSTLTEISMTDIDGWWDDGVSVTAQQIDKGAVFGYLSNITVVHDNLEVTVVITVDRDAPASYGASIDQITEDLLAQVHSTLDES